MKIVSMRMDEETKETLEKLKKELHISNSGIIRMAVKHFYNYVKRVNGE